MHNTMGMQASCFYPFLQGKGEKMQELIILYNLLLLHCLDWEILKF